jgi:hypothetical protein
VYKTNMYVHKYTYTLTLLHYTSRYCFWQTCCNSVSKKWNFRHGECPETFCDIRNWKHMDKREKFSIWTIIVMSMKQVYILVCMLGLLVPAAIWNEWKYARTQIVQIFASLIPTFCVVYFSNCRCQTNCH